MRKLFEEIDLLQKEINTYKPLQGKLLKQTKDYYRVGLTYTSNALEGNTLTESETKIVLEEGMTASGKPLKDYFEAVGHAEAYDFLYTLIKKKEIEEKDLKKFHKLIYLRIEEKRAGRYRKEPAVITGSKYPLPKPSELNPLMKQFILNLQKYRHTKHPIEVAALAHKEFVFIHPFIDGNGRVARLLMNLLLLQEGYSIAVIPPMQRRTYIDALEKAHVKDQDFINLIGLMVKETQKDFLRLFV